MEWIKLAFRNVLRNKRRSFITIFAIGIGFTSVSLYQGYIHNAYKGLRYLATHVEGHGHLTIHKAGWQEKGKLEPEKYMFSKEEIETMMKLIREEDSVMLATPKIHVTGWVTNGQSSTIFLATGIVPSDTDKINQSVSSDLLYNKKDATLFEGKRLSDDKPYGVLMAKGLARYLNLKLGMDGAVVAQTVNGRMNVMDVQVNGIFETGNEFSNDKVILLNFQFAQSLLDTQSAEKIVVFLKDWKKTETMRDLFFKKIKSAGIDCEIRTWDKLSLVYPKMKSWLDTIFMFLSSVMLAIAVIGTINTMGMTIMERTQEIGTLRALGLKCKGISLLFTLEGAFLGSLGSIIGVMMHTFVWTFIKIFPLYYTPPGMSEPVAMRVDMVPEFLSILVVCFIVLATIAAIIPARAAARKNIIDALGHT